MFAYIVVKALSKVENEYVKNFTEALHKTVVFRFIIRAVLATFVQICIMAFAGFYKSTSIVSLAPTLQFASCCVAMLCFAAILFAMLVPRSVVENKEFKQYFGALYDGIKTNAGRANMAYTAIFLARRALFVLALLQDTFIVQFTGVIVLSMLNICYILHCKPHEEKATYYMEIFNEFVLLGALYFLPLFSNMVTDNALKFQLGWCFNIVLLIPLFGVNLVFTFFTAVKQICEEVRAAGKSKQKIVVVADKEIDDADKFGIEASEKKAFNKQNLECIVEELPEAEEYEATIEKEAFLQNMQKRGLDLKPIEKDGNCVFRAIGLLLFEDQAKHMQVRHDIVNQIIEKRDKYEKNISYSKGAIETFDAYVQNMRLEGIWGDHVELQAAADMYGVDINVYTVGTGVDRPNLIVECTGEIEYLPISLWFEDDNHYHAFTDSASAEPAEDVAPEMVALSEASEPE